MTAPHDTPRFVWPPRPLPPDPTAPATRPALAPTPTQPIPRVIRWWREVEEAWLDPLSRPLSLRIPELEWAPELIDALCDRCGQVIGPSEADEFGCTSCRRRRFPWGQIVTLGPYEGPLAEWIKEVKFERGHRLGRDLGRLLGDRIRLSTPGVPDDALVVPVPMPWLRRQTRGVHHTMAIARGVADALNRPVSQALWTGLFRRSQRSVPVSRRRSNVSRAFRPAPWARVKGRTVILIDDVTTTGATLRAAARALRRGRESRQDRVIAAVLAVTPIGSRRGRTGIDSLLAEGTDRPSPGFVHTQGLPSMRA